MEYGIGYVGIAKWNASGSNKLHNLILFCRTAHMTVSGNFQAFLFDRSKSKTPGTFRVLACIYDIMSMNSSWNTLQCINHSASY